MRESEKFTFTVEVFIDSAAWAAMYPTPYAANDALMALQDDLERAAENFSHAVHDVSVREVK